MPASAAGRRGPGASAVWRKLPLLLLVAVGVALWQSPLVPREREIVFELPHAPVLREAEVQLWRGDQLLKREQRFFTAPAPFEWVQKLALKNGDYRAEVFARTARGESLHATHLFRVQGDEPVRLPLLAR